MNVMPSFPQLMQDQDIAFSLHVAGVDEGKLLVTAFEAEERLNGLTRVDVALTSADSGIDLTTILDKNVTLTIHNKYAAASRHFSGVVAAVSRGDTGHRRTAYQLTILPPISRLAHISDSRIFQDVTVPEIVQTLLKEHGIDQVRWDLDSRLHQKREFCVCFNETLLAFIERSCAEEGIWTYFVHEAEGKNIVVFVDETTATPWCEHQKELEYNAMASGAVKGVYCSHLSWREQLRSTSYVQKDYTFKNPPHGLRHSHPARELNGVQDLYPVFEAYGRYKHDDQGRPFTRYKLEATRVDASTGEGFANAPHLTAGHRFQLTDHPKKALNDKYLILSVRHSGRQPQALGTDAAALVAGSDLLDSFALSGSALSSSFGARLAGAGMTGAGSGARAAALGSLPGASAHPLGAGASPLPSTARDGMAEATLYANSFTIMPARLPYRPPQLMKPLVDGPQIAAVVGPHGEEIYTDEHGRVKVQFTWDRYGKSDDRSSCWIRVAQNWGGASWGHIAIPRIGHEVIVDFLQGDPDQPVIVGRTYHMNNRPPYKLPDHKTKSVWRSDTHKGRGFNEISFEDQAGEENMFLHAQKDQTIKVLNNRAKRVNANQVESIGANKSIDVGGNHQEKIGGSMNISVGGGSGGLLGALAAMIGGSGKQMEQAAKSIGDPVIAASVLGMAEAGAAVEVASLGANGAFAGAGNHFFEAGKDQMSTASSLGGLLSKIMPLSGILNTIVEKIKSDTIGLMRTEQIGLLKNTMVGHTQTTTVGKKIDVKVGQLYNIVSGEKYHGEAKVWEIYADDEIRLSAPGGYITIDKKGIHLHGLKIDIEGNQINFKQGGKGEGASCLRQMVKSSTPFVRG